MLGCAPMPTSPKTKPRLLRFVPFEHPILRQRCTTVEFPLDSGDLRLINNMCYSIQGEQLLKAGAAWEGAVGMAANQWGKARRIFLYCPTGDTEEGLEVVINPSYKPIASATTPTGEVPQETSWESCFSVPLCSGHVARYASIEATHQDMDGKQHTRELHGWEARVWQHENDHVDGFLYVAPQFCECLEVRRFATRDEVSEFYKSLHAEQHVPRDAQTDDNNQHLIEESRDTQPPPPTEAE